MGTLLKTDLDRLTYVVIEVELSRQTSEKLIGSFVGYKPLVTEHTQIASKDESFLWMSKGDQIHIISLDHYKVTDVRCGMGVGTSKILSTKFWTAHNVIEELIEIRNALTAKGWADETGIIDVTRYTHMPFALKEEVEGKAKASTPATPHGQNRGAGNQTTYAYKKKEVTTAIIKRTTRYDSAAAIEMMHKKIESIRDGKYEAPKLKVTSADKVEKENEKKAVEEKTGGSAAAAGQENYEDENFPWGGTD